MKVPFLDILRIIIFNFLFLTKGLNVFSVSYTLFTIILVVLASAIITIFLAWLIGTIHHKVKFVPILLTLVLFIPSANIFIYWVLLLFFSLVLP